MTASSRALALAAALAVTWVARDAAAGDGAAAAEVLFGEGKKLAQDGNYAAACPKFEESQKLDPGMGTLYRLADCYEHVGRTASAWAAFLEVASAAKSAGQQARADDAKKRADDLAPKLAKLVVGVAEPDLQGLVVKRGDVEIGRAQWNAPIPVDPGDVVVEAAAPGRKPWRGQATVAPGGVGRVEIPKLLPEDAPSSPAPQGAPPPKERRESSSFGAQRTLAVALGVGGVVGLGIGTAFGIRSMGKGSDANRHCDAQNLCDAQGVTLRHDAIVAGRLSNLGFAAGGVLLAGAAVVWFTAPPRSSSSGAAVPHGIRAGIMPQWGGASLHVEVP